MALGRGLNPAIQSVQGCRDLVVGRHCPPALQRRAGKAGRCFSAHDARRDQAISWNEPASLPALEAAVARTEAPYRGFTECQSLRARLRFLALERFLQELSFAIRRNAFGNPCQVKIPVALKMLDADCEIGCHADIRDVSPPLLIMNPHRLITSDAGWFGSILAAQQTGGPTFAEDRDRASPAPCAV